MKCPSCHQDIPDGSNFCGFCGGRIRQHTSAPVVQAPAPAPTPADDADLRATLIGSVPTFSADGDDIQATVAMSSLRPDELESVATSLDPVLPPEAEVIAAEVVAPVVAAPVVAAPVVAAPVVAAPRPAGPVPSVIIESSVQREVARLAQEGPDTARDLGNASDIIAAAQPAAAAPQPAAAPVAQAAPAPVAEAPRAEPRKPSAAPAAQAAPVAQKPKTDAPKADPKTASKADPKRSNAPKGAKPAAEGEGGFRETVWFMQSIDPEKLGDLERDDPSQRQDEYQKQKDAKVEDEQRREFSLNVENANTRDTGVRNARVRAEQSSTNRALVLGIVVVVLGGLGAAAWFLFAR